MPEETTYTCMYKLYQRNCWWIWYAAVLLRLNIPLLNWLIYGENKIHQYSCISKILLYINLWKKHWKLKTHIIQIFIQVKEIEILSLAKCYSYFFYYKYFWREFKNVILYLLVYSNILNKTWKEHGHDLGWKFSNCSQFFIM